jgi:hypothetical protein
MHTSDEGYDVCELKEDGTAGAFIKRVDGYTNDEAVCSSCAEQYSTDLDELREDGAVWKPPLPNRTSTV